MGLKESPVSSCAIKWWFKALRTLDMKTGSQLELLKADGTEATVDDTQAESAQVHNTQWWESKEATEAVSPMEGIRDQSL